jgi:nucleotide-binding universal stress UspA family protein
MENEARRANVYLQKVAERLQKGGLQVDWEVRRGGAAEQIVRCANERDIDLIAISTHGRSGFSRLVFGSVAQKVMHNIGRPMLVIAPRGKSGGGDAAEG